MIDILNNQFVPLIIAPYCITIGFIILYRIKSAKDKVEIFLFFILTFIMTIYALTPLFNRVIKIYDWIISILLISSALIYAIYISYRKLYKYILPYLITGSLILFFLIFRGEYNTLNFSIKYLIIMSPLIIAINIVLFHYYFKHKNSFHLSLAILCIVMTIGGIYDIFKPSTFLPNFPAATISSFVFVLVIGYQLLGRKYLINYEEWNDFVKEAEQNEKLLKEKYILLKKAKVESLVILSQTIEAKDPYTRGHCLRVRDFAKIIGKELGFDKDKLLFLEFGALLHDVGKIGIPGVILNKSSQLTQGEYHIIQKHPEIGAKIIKNVEYYAPLIPMIKHHHEFYNGEGYPDRLMNDDIPLEARILSVGDVFDAITSDRPYRKALNIEEALKILMEISGHQLDPVLVDLFIHSKIYKMKHPSSERLVFDF